MNINKEEIENKYFEYLLEIIRVTVYHNSSRVLAEHDEDKKLIHIVSTNICDLTIEHLKELKRKKEIKNLAWI